MLKIIRFVLRYSLFLVNHQVYFSPNHTVINLYFTITGKWWHTVINLLFQRLPPLPSPKYITNKRNILYFSSDPQRLSCSNRSVQFKNGSLPDEIRFSHSPPLPCASPVELYCYLSPLWISLKETAEFLLLFISLFSAIYCYSSLFSKRKQHSRGQVLHCWKRCFENLSL